MKNRATVFSDKSAVIQTRQFVIVPVPQKSAETPMPAQPDNPLQEYVLKVMRDGGLSFADVENEARRRGGTLGRATIQQIAKGSTTNPGIFTLVELSWGLKKSVEEVITTTLGEHLTDLTAFEKSELARVWEKSKQLPSGEQRMFRRYLQMLEREICRILSGD